MPAVAEVQQQFVVVDFQKELLEQEELVAEEMVLFPEQQQTVVTVKVAVAEGSFMVTLDQEAAE